MVRNLFTNYENESLIRRAQQDIHMKMISGAVEIAVSRGWITDEEHKKYLLSEDPMFCPRFNYPKDI